MLSAKQKRFVLARSQGLTIKAAAEQVGGSERNGQRWDALPEVQGAIDVIGEERFRAGSREVKADVPLARLVLRSAAINAPVMADRIRAARSILEFAVRFKEAEQRAEELDLRDETNELKRLVEEIKQSRGAKRGFARVG